VGRGSAVCALDRGWRVAVVAVDGGQGWRRWSGEEPHSGKERLWASGARVSS
jgi:hypothetical protein